MGWFFTGDYNGTCVNCSSQNRDFTNGNCLDCGQTRKAEHNAFKIAVEESTQRMTVNLRTGPIHEEQEWEVFFRRDTDDSIFIQLIHINIEDEKQHESLEYKMIGEDEVDLERRCTEFKTFNDFFSRGMQEGRRPNIGAEASVVPDEEGRAPLISCADSRVMAFQTVNAATKFWVKEKQFDLETVLGKGVVTIECNWCDGSGIQAITDTL